ncbi:MAG: HvfC/BufC family peptide modification chaperone, partial [Burkholderiaceae bacterium]
MSPLALQQQALLAALFGAPPDAIKLIAPLAHGAWVRGLNAYQANGHAVAGCSLRAAYPVLAQLLGEDSFEALACALWHARPPARGDLALWGEDLASFVAASAQLADEPYLADVARVEWALHG